MQQTGLTKLAVLTALSLLAAALIYPTTFSFFRKPFAARQARVTSRSQLRNMSIQAIHVNKSGHPSGLELTEIPIPTISSPHDILVKIKGVALNPVDTKVRGGAATGRILGYDASGIVEAAGDQAIFKKGDSVIYAGAIGRPGSNQQYQLVDSRIAAKKPESLAWDDAAALPLVSITAWEMFEDKFRLKPFTDNSKEILLIVNGAGGVGSIAIELAKKVTYAGFVDFGALLIASVL
jgi:NADPH:quinone reductase